MVQMMRVRAMEFGLMVLSLAMAAPIFAAAQSAPVLQGSDTCANINSTGLTADSRLHASGVGYAFAFDGGLQVGA